MKNFENQADIILNCPLFNGVAKERLPAVLECLGAQKRVFLKNKDILSEEQSAQKIGIVLSGSVDIVKIDFWGNRSILSRIGPGGLFGEAFACAGVSRLPVSAVASGQSEILLLQYQKISGPCPKNCSHHNLLIQNMMKVLAGKNILLTQKIEHITKRSTREKLLSYLSEQAELAGNSSFVIPFNRQELADYLSVDRSAMSNELCKLRDEGILQFHKNCFILL